MFNTQLYRYSRLFAFLLLGVITLYGLFRLIVSDWSEVTAFWASHSEIILLLVLISALDVALECVAWMLVYRRFQVKAFDRIGMLSFLSGRAGLLMPAQLGRLIRPDAMSKQQRTSFSNALKAEAVIFALDAVAVVSLLSGLIVYKLFPIAAPMAAFTIIAFSLLTGNYLTRALTHTRIEFPVEFWWKWPTLLIVLISMAGWIMHGLGLHVVVAELPGEMTLWDSMFFGPGSAVLGVATGLPGGIGATETFLGASLRIRSVPVEHLALAVAAFRLITFWMWIPIGWLAIAALRKITPQVVEAVGEPSG